MDSEVDLCLTRRGRKNFQRFLTLASRYKVTFRYIARLGGRILEVGSRCVSSSRSNSFRVRHSGASCSVDGPEFAQWDPRRLLASAAPPPVCGVLVGGTSAPQQEHLPQGHGGGSGSTRSIGTCVRSAVSGGLKRGGSSGCMNSRRKSRGFFDAYRDRARELADPASVQAADRGPAAGRRQGGGTRPGPPPRPPPAGPSTAAPPRTPASGCCAAPGTATRPSPARPGRPRSARRPGTPRTTSPVTSASIPATAPCPAPRPPTPTPSPGPSGRKPSGPPATTPASARHARGLNHQTRRKAVPAKREPHGKRIRQYGARREINLAKCSREIPVKTFP